MGHRFWHTTVAVQFSSRMRQVFLFGGCPGAPESHTSGTWDKMAKSVIVELGKQFLHNIIFILMLWGPAAAEDEHQSLFVFFVVVFVYIIIYL